MELKLPFDPIKRAREVEKIVMKGNSRLYYRFRPALYYGGIATADAIGCSFLCAYCWNYNRNLHPERFGKFYYHEDVSSNLLSIAEKKSFNLFRITGSEPILGEVSFKHLIEIIKVVFKKKAWSKFVIETNGLVLGYRSNLIKYLKFTNLQVRIAIKGVDEKSFESITGAKKDFFIYPIRAVKELQKEHIKAWPAVMRDLFKDSEIESLKDILRKEGIKGDIELEKLESYPFVLDNMKKRRITLKRD
jgi:uncharacterized Fe-S cluster-containing radical SAM superfamily protein